MTIASIDPTTGTTVEVFAPLDDAALTARLDAADAACRGWRARSFAERGRLLTRVADFLEAERETLARTMTLEMGKLLRAARDEVTKSALACRFYAERAAGFLAHEPIGMDGADAVVHHVPLGVVLAIMPWNYPVWQVIRAAAPALMAGNVVLLKHAESVPRCALALEALFRRAGAPEGVFQTLLLTVGQVEPVLDRVAGVTLTGSTRAGRQVAAAAGRRLRKVVLELGGSDPFVVLPSADLDAVVAAAVAARVVNNGQSCIAAKRFVVAMPVAEAFERRFVAAMAALRVGDPLAADTDLGPLATAAIRDELAAQVRTSVARGTRLLLGGDPPDRPGFWYPPTVLAEPPTGSPAREQELFGPVATLFRARDLDDAIRIANDTPFGLGASVWTADPNEQQRLAASIEAGMVFVNRVVASDPRLPFGGIKDSGIGRELGAWGIREFTGTRTVVVGRPR